MKRYSVNSLDLKQLADELKRGSVIIYPTETVAGIGCIGSNKKSVERVFAAKNRDADKPVSYAFANMNMARKYVNVPTSTKPLLSLFPGPVTMIFSRIANSPPLYGIDSESVGVRIPDLPWLLQLIELVGEPIITTSANISSFPTANTIAKMLEDKELINYVDTLIEWEGELHGTPSTVIDCRDKPKIIREGDISKKQIDELLLG